MGTPANFPTKCGVFLATQPGAAGATITSIDEFGIFPLANKLFITQLSPIPVLQVNDVIFAVRFTPLGGNADPFFFVSLNFNSVDLLAAFELTDSIGGLIEIEFFDVSINFFRTISFIILFDFTLPASGSPLNPNHLPGSWKVTHAA